jgi:hypothetical protein
VPSLGGETAAWQVESCLYSPTFVRKHRVVILFLSATTLVGLVIWGFDLWHLFMHKGTILLSAIHNSLSSQSSTENILDNSICSCEHSTVNIAFILDRRLIQHYVLFLFQQTVCFWSFRSDLSLPWWGLPEAMAFSEECRGKNYKSNFSRFIQMTWQWL